MKTLAAAFAFGAALAPALPVAALSCLPADPVRIYTQARDAEARYRIVHGTLTAQQTIRKHKQDMTRTTPPKPIRVKARLQGMQLGQGGFATPIDLPVTVEMVCYGPWCGNWPGAGQMLMSVEEQKGGQLVVTADPCLSQIYAKPTRQELDRVVRCHRAGRCPTEMR
ncbi:hypothetical protein [Vannielia litorea]|uniref:Lipoprotein n=1 Tax=Vannielia litorea TaxID=1217970 RepID=A0A1N6IIB0_9RHOB|nr:hypothetical protein [Vannielia litorea]SIO31713.1 hypothetical protein SAMN05444002_3927 [Vannielia litorea]